MALKCTKISLPPSCSMKPKPLRSLNHFTLPSDIVPILLSQNFLSRMITPAETKRPPGFKVLGGRPCALFMTRFNLFLRFFYVDPRSWAHPRGVLRGCQALFLYQSHSAANFVVCVVGFLDVYKNTPAEPSPCRLVIL